MTPTTDHKSESPIATRANPSPGTPLLTGVAAGLAAAVAASFAWFITEWPTIHLPMPAAFAVLAVIAVVTGSLVRRTGPGLTSLPQRLVSGMVAGLVMALLGTQIVGSVLVVQPESREQLAAVANQLRSEAPLIAGGFVLGCLIVGVSASLIGAGGSSAITSGAASMDAERARRVWLGRAAWAAAAALLPLISIGGMVTSSGSGMAVPDAVTSYGTLPQLLPLSVMEDPRIFLEHVHRLFGWMAGISCLLLLACTLAVRGVGARAAGVFALGLAIAAQAVLGITRVAENNVGIGLMHGLFALLVLAYASGLAVMMSPAVSDGAPLELSALARVKKLRGWMIALVVVLVVQISFAAMYRHFAARGSSAANHGLWSHVGFSLVAMGMLGVVGAMLMRAGKGLGHTRTAAGAGPGAGLFRVGALMHGLLTLQLTLGFVALLMTGQGERTVPTADELATAAPIEHVRTVWASIHHTGGALLMATTGAAMAMVWRRR